MKKWFALLLAVLMLCAMTGCGDKSKPDDKDTPTTTTPSTTTPEPEVVPIELVEGEIPADCYWTEDTSFSARNVAVMMKANVNLADIRWLALNPDPPTIDRVLYNHSLNKGEIWTVNTYINDAVPNRGIACTDENGKTYCYAIAYSLKGDGSPSLSLTALNIEVLSEAKLDEIEAYLNDKENNGFVSMNEYDCPEESSLDDILYDRTAGQHHSSWSDAERQAWLDANGFTEDYFVRPVYRFYRTDLETLIQQKLGITLSALENDMLYLEEYDAYYDYSHSDSQLQQAEVESGYAESDFCVVYYKMRQSENFDYELFRVTLKPTDDGYQFVSNVEISAATNTIHLSSEQLDKINTFLNDPDNLGFVQRTFDRPEEVQWIEVLTADVTFGVAINEWSDAERQALADALEYDMAGVIVRFPRADVEALFQKRLGISPTELDTPISAVYLEEYDAYYLSFLGIEWVPTNVISGKIENGVYIVDCSFGYYDEARRVTMRATDDGFQFISNVAIED